MLNIFSFAFLILAAYALGCFSTAYYLVRWRTGEDIRNVGSGTAGARNVGRILGRVGFALTFIGDALKGALAVGLARWFDLGALGLVVAVLAVVAGHLWPIQLGGKGGKGASTALGAVLVIHVWLGLGTLLAALLFLPITRSVNRAGMIAMALVPILAYLLRLDAVIIGGMVALALLLLFAHRENWSATRPKAPAQAIENPRIENQPH